MPSDHRRGDFDCDVQTIQRTDAVTSILEVVCRTTGMGFAAVARVTEERWIACAVKDDIQFGLKPGGELKVETTLCHEIRQSGTPVVIEHVAQDHAFCGHPTPAMYGFQSYISVPIVRADGSFFGTLCAIDPQPAVLRNPQTVGMFKLFAELIAYYLDAADRLATSEASLVGMNRESDLRDQFIAVLGHDLRNPLASIQAGTDLLAKRMPDPRASEILSLMQSSAARMSALIDDVLDFARGRLGSGLELRRSTTALEPVIRQIVEELQATAPDRAIECDFALQHPVYCDGGRIGQLLSNLLANALTHGSAATPIRIFARSDEQTLELSVHNSGAPIPPSTLEKLFQPFFRGEERSSRLGLGLGLYIASEVARAHGGTLQATSTPEETSFVFRMPSSAVTG
jgi:signal transduction histidine kinase